MTDPEQLEKAYESIRELSEEDRKRLFDRLANEYQDEWFDQGPKWPRTGINGGLPI